MAQISVVGTRGVGLSTVACMGAHVLVVLTEWAEYARVDPVEVAEKLLTKSVIDARNVPNRDVWKAAGFTYRGVGR
jgi:UDPglucose 6-dehydrogenase